MASKAKKRKADELMQESPTMMRFQAPANTPPKEEDDEGDEKFHRDDFANDAHDVETPLTPFSPAPITAPGQKRIKSEMKHLNCPYPGCDKTYNRPVRLESHLRTHTDDRACKCPYPDCDKAYYEDKHLQQHIKGSHKTERTYACDREGCGKSFLTGTRLRRHIDTHKGLNRFNCSGYPGCDKTFRKHQTLQRHIRSDHLQLIPFPCAFVDPVTKIQCNAGFDGAAGLRRHMERDHTPSKYVCTSCVAPNSYNPDGTPKTLGFSSDHQLRNHIRKEHADCLFCDLKFSGRRELQAHIDSQHSGKSIEERRVHRCHRPGCRKAFTTSSNLAAHVRSTHDGQRFICGNFDVSYHPGLSIFDPANACGKELFSKANLEDHIRTAHLGLASEINANRLVKYETSSDSNSAYSIKYSDSDSDCDHELLDTKSTRRKPAKSRKHKATVIDELVGTAQASDPRRNIVCPATGCNHRFIRQYDLDNHMAILHPAQPFPPFPRDSLSRQASPSEQQLDNFWIGAATPAQTPGLDVWRHDEAEMRRLIGEEHIDPALVGL